MLNKKNILIVGHTGTGKTIIVENQLKKNFSN